MAPESGEPEATISGVSMDDFKKLEASMGAQMEELCAMMAQLLNANKAPASPSLAVKLPPLKLRRVKDLKNPLLN